MGEVLAAFGNSPPLVKKLLRFAFFTENDKNIATADSDSGQTAVTEDWVRHVWCLLGILLYHYGGSSQLCCTQKALCASKIRHFFFLLFKEAGKGKTTLQLKHKFSAKGDCHLFADGSSIPPQIFSLLMQAEITLWELRCGSSLIIFVSHLICSS